MKKSTLIILLALLLVASMTFGNDGSHVILPQNPGPFKRIDRSGLENTHAELLRHQRNMARRTQAASGAVSQDVGDVAVVVDNGSIIIQPQQANPFDLALPTNITFNPTAGGFAVTFAAPSVDPVIGSALSLGDDDTTEVSFGGMFSFPFLGNSYSSIFVNSDGNITLGAGDSASTPRDAARLVGGPPRIAPFLQDLNVETGGSINASVRTDRVVVTWTAVPEFGTSNPNTLQVTLHDSGRIEFAYTSLASTFAVIGVAEGNNEGPINEIDYTAELPATLQSGAIFEEFIAGNPKQVDVVALAQEFYRTHGDEFDFQVMFTDFPFDLGGALASEANIKNETEGLNLGTFDLSSIFGSQGELESFVVMNNIGLYWPDARKLVDPPIDMFRSSGGASILGPPGADQFSRRARLMGTDANGIYDRGLNSAMSVMGQEVGHRWGAYVPFVHPTKGISFDSFDLLGRDFAHWSFFFNVRVPASQFGGDPRSSSLEGNAIIDFGGPLAGFCTGSGEGAFRTEGHELVDGYTNLDQYLLGLRRAEEVGSFWYVDEPRAATGQSLEGFRGRLAFEFFFFCGKRVNLTVANIQAFPGVGPRIPALGDEDDDGQGNDVKTMAFILLVEQGPPSSHASAISQVDNFRRTWQEYANGPATGGRGKFDTSLNPAVH